MTSNQSPFLVRSLTTLPNENKVCAEIVLLTNRQGVTVYPSMVRYMVSVLPEYFQARNLMIYIKRTRYRAMPSD
jgi:hypothetical protein